MKILTATLGAILLAGLSAPEADAKEGKAAPLWSLQPIANPQPPHDDAHPVDAFLRAKPSPRAERRALIRRVCYDLTGLPPTPTQVDTFITDKRSDTEAFATVVDELLRSPHYGERWGRHWLDVVRYADTAGENSDHPLPHAWRYRNWVIGAFNNDKPYDQFVREQLAGDILAKAEGKSPEERTDSLIATGYLAIARRFGHDIDKRIYLMHEDVIDNFGKAFLGLSISCARCHDHKHDPITARDYYSLYSVFDSTRFSFPGCEPKQQPRDLVELPATGELKARRLAWEQRRNELQAEAAAKNPESQAIELRDLAAKSHKIVSQGDVPDAGSVFVTEKGTLEIGVRKGEAIQLSILPQENYGADTTILDYTINHTADGKETRWSVADLIDDLLISNPHPAEGGAQWCFLDTTGDVPKILTGKNEAVDGKAALRAWENGAPPSVLVNISESPVNVWTTLPPRTFFCHPGPNGPIAIAWLSPIDGKVNIHLKISDGHPFGDGVGWRIEHFADPQIAGAFRELSAASGDGKAKQALANHLTKEPKIPVAYGVTEAEAKPARVHHRGNHEDLGEQFPRKFLSMLGGGALGDENSSGRLELARHVTDSDNPLTARVMVNRIWAWHFGRGLVSTTNDFGRHGTPPSHPELLDYLARYFVENGWSVKAMHRLMLSSAAYQQAAGDDQQAEKYNAFGRRRITAEEMRDTLLVASGELDRTPGEAHPFPPESTWNFTQHNPFAAEYETRKRSVYVMQKRNRAMPFFTLFDGPDPNASTAQRGATTVPTQALYFMNNRFVHDCAAKFATRIITQADSDKSRLDFACRELFARPATDEDLVAFEEFAKTLGQDEHETWRSYARILLGSNELLYID